MGALQGRSPMEVATGIQPQLPAMLKAGVPLMSQSPNDYVTDLIEYLRSTHELIQEKHAEAMAKSEGTAKGRHNVQLKPGDIVVRRKPTTQRPHGTHRFETKGDNHLYRIKQALGDNTYALESILGDQAPGVHGQVNKHPAELLIKLDMPEFQQEVQKDCRRGIEIWNERGGQWLRGTVERLACDGRVCVRFDAMADRGQWLDLTKQRYRWLIGANEVSPSTCERRE